MPLRRVLLLALLSIAEAMPAQQIDSATRAEREGWRIILLDSLAKGRQRWKRAAIDSYVIQSHVGCFLRAEPFAAWTPNSRSSTSRA